MNAPTKYALPSLDGATGWLNSAPLTPDDLRGKVVLVDFWTYTCINWLRTLGYVRAWAEKYESHGLVVIGVHTPEFPFEHDIDNVRWAAKELTSSIRSRSTPTMRCGARSTTTTGPRLTSPTPKDGSGTTSSAKVGTRSANGPSRRCCAKMVATALPTISCPSPTTASRRKRTGQTWSRPRRTSAPRKLRTTRLVLRLSQLRLNQWTLLGDWTVGTGASVLQGADGQIVFRFHARDVNLVMGPRVRGTSVPFRVLVDGEPPGEAHGLDVDDQGKGTLTQQRLYQLIREPGSIAERTFEITFDAPDVEAYCFTFG